MIFYDENIVNTVTDNATVGWEDAMPVLIILGFTCLLGMFTLTMVMREWAWLNQFNEDV